MTDHQPLNHALFHGPQVPIEVHRIKKANAVKVPSPERRGNFVHPGAHKTPLPSIRTKPDSVPPGAFASGQGSDKIEMLERTICNIYSSVSQSSLEQYFSLLNWPTDRLRPPRLAGTALTQVTMLPRPTMANDHRQGT